MTVKEVYNIWKQDVFKGLKCIYGGLDGGPGFLGFGSCKSDKHTNVRYGCESCPKNCSDFQEVTEDVLYIIFCSLYRNSSNFYNKKYNIDENDPDHIPNYKPYSGGYHTNVNINHEPEDPTELF